MEGVHRLAQHNDVVARTAVNFADTKLGLIPVHAIRAFSIANVMERRIVAGVLTIVHRHAQIVHADEALLLNQRIIHPAVRFPRGAVSHHAFAPHRMMQHLLRGGACRIYQCVIDQ